MECGDIYIELLLEIVSISSARGQYFLLCAGQRSGRSSQLLFNPGSESSKICILLLLSEIVPDSSARGQFFCAGQRSGGSSQLLFNPASKSSKICILLLLSEIVPDSSARGQYFLLLRRPEKWREFPAPVQSWK